jgi:hypothetical protein
VFARGADCRANWSRWHFTPVTSSSIFAKDTLGEPIAAVAARRHISGVCLKGSARLAAFPLWFAIPTERRVRRCNFDKVKILFAQVAAIFHHGSTDRGD